MYEKRTPDRLAQYMRWRTRARPSSRSSESSLESGSPTSYMPLQHLRYPDPFLDPISFQRPQALQHKQERVVVHRKPEQPKCADVPLRREVSRPRPCYPDKENIDPRAMRGSPPEFACAMRGSAPEFARAMPSATPEFTLRGAAPQIAAAPVLVARCGRANAAVEMGRYVTVMMDTSYKLAALALHLYRRQPRQVPVRTIQ